MKDHTLWPCSLLATRRGKTFGLQPKQTPGSRSDLHCSDIMNMAENTGTPTVVVGVVLEAGVVLVVN